MPSGLSITSLHKTEGEVSFLTGHLWTPNPGRRLRRKSSNHTVIKRRCAKAHTGVHRYSAWQSRGCTLEQDRPPAFLPPAHPTPSRSPCLCSSTSDSLFLGGGHCLDMKLMLSSWYFLACQVYTLHFGLLWLKNENPTPPGPTPSLAGPSAAFTSQTTATFLIGQTGLNCPTAFRT